MQQKTKKILPEQSPGRDSYWFFPDHCMKQLKGVLWRTMYRAISRQPAAIIAKAETTLFSSTLSGIVGIKEITLFVYKKLIAEG